MVLVALEKGGFWIFVEEDILGLDGLHASSERKRNPG